MPYYFYDATYILVLIGCADQYVCFLECAEHVSGVQQSLEQQKHPIAGYCTDDPSRCRNL